MSPAAIRSSVVLPAPLRPSTPTTSPGRTARSTPSSTGGRSERQRLATPRTSSTGIGGAVFVVGSTASLAGGRDTPSVRASAAVIYSGPLSLARAGKASRLPQHRGGIAAHQRAVRKGLVRRRRRWDSFSGALSF